MVPPQRSACGAALDPMSVGHAWEQVLEPQGSQDEVVPDVGSAPNPKASVRRPGRRGRWGLRPGPEPRQGLAEPGRPSEPLVPRKLQRCGGAQKQPQIRNWLSCLV